MASYERKTDVLYANDERKLEKYRSPYFLDSYPDRNFPDTGFWSPGFDWADTGMDLEERKRHPNYNHKAKIKNGRYRELGNRLSFCMEKAGEEIGGKEDRGDYCSGWRKRI
ncbi:MAG TPA: hypothetical protein IAA44_02570 [Candidatus Blautia avistercoris]|nr:hypothetical protein [Candidatus Blautia avistercoris]